MTALIETSPHSPQGDCVTSPFMVRQAHRERTVAHWIQLLSRSS